MTGRYPRAHFVYRLYEGDTVIYVGMTGRFPERMQNHYTADYADRITDVRTERFPTRDDAADREFDLIVELAPELNVQGVAVSDYTAPEPGRCLTCGEDTHWSAVACRGCVQVEYHRYITTQDKMADCGARLGVTRQRVKQLFDVLAGPGIATKVKRSVKAEQSADLAEARYQADLIVAERDGVKCATCGRLHARRGTGDNGWARTCSSECAELFREVRYFDNDFYVEHRQRVAQWQVRNPEKVPDHMVRNGVRVLRGEPARFSNAGKRWLIPGSRRWEIAVRAYREGWPAFETWPEPIRRQVVEYVDGAVAA